MDLSAFLVKVWCLVSGLVVGVWYMVYGKYLVLVNWSSGTNWFSLVSGSGVWFIPGIRISGVWCILFCSPLC